MPPFTQKYCTQDAVLWRAKGKDRFNELIIDSPESIKVRWEQSDREILDDKGNKIRLDGQVVVKERIPINSLLYLGTASEFVTDPLGMTQGGVLGLSQGGVLYIEVSGSGLEGVEILQVVIYTEIPDVKGRRIRRTAGLIRYKETLPELG